MTVIAVPDISSGTPFIYSTVTNAAHVAAGTLPPVASPIAKIVKIVVSPNVADIQEKRRTVGAPG